MKVMIKNFHCIENMASLPTLSKDPFANEDDFSPTGGLGSGTFLAPSNPGGRKCAGRDSS